MTHISFTASRARSRLGSLALAAVLAVTGTSAWLAATTTVAQAAPTVRSSLKAAKDLYSAGSYKEALAAIEEGLKLAPKNQELLSRKVLSLLKLREYEQADVAYKAYLAAGGKSGDLDSTMKNVQASILNTRFEIVAPAGAASVVVVVKDLPFCSPGPTCVKSLPAGTYAITAEAEGFEPWSGEANAVVNQTTRVELGLVEKPSLLTVKASPELATITLDGAPFTSPGPIPGGTHQLTLALPGYATTKREVTAHLGKPVELSVELPRITLVAVTPNDATILLDGQPVTLDNGGLSLPPGKHVLVAEAKGFHKGSHNIAADRTADYKIDLVLKEDRPEEKGPGRFTPRRKIAIVSAGVSLAAIGAGIYLGLDAKKLEDDSYALCPVPNSCREPDRANDLIDRADSRALQANIAYGVAGVAAVGAVVLWITGKPETQSRVAVTPRFAAPSTGTAVTGVDLSLKF